MLFDTRVEEQDGWSVVRVLGDVDISSLPAWRQAVDRALGRAGVGLSPRAGAEPGPVAVDLTGVELLDPVTVGVLVAAATRARRAGAPFEVRCAAGRVRELLAETGLDRILVVRGPDDGSGSPVDP